MNSRLAKPLINSWSLLPWEEIHDVQWTQELAGSEREWRINVGSVGSGLLCQSLQCPSVYTFYLPQRGVTTRVTTLDIIDNWQQCKVILAHRHAHLVSYGQWKFNCSSSPTAEETNFPCIWTFIWTSDLQMCLFFEISFELAVNTALIPSLMS